MAKIRANLSERSLSNGSYPATSNYGNELYQPKNRYVNAQYEIHMKHFKKEINARKRLLQNYSFPRNKKEKKNKLPLIINFKNSTSFKSLRPKCVNPISTSMKYNGI